MNKLIILLTAMLIFALGSGIGAAIEIHVNQTDSIQAAVNNAGSGDVIIVKPGIYNENIRITTQNLVIRSESGNSENTIIKASPNTSVFYTAASNTTISGFKIESGDTGIYLVRCSGCTITNNDLSDNKLGISLSSANNNKISGNRANSNKMYGIQLVSSEGNTLLNNSANSNERGINHLSSNKSMISGNDVSNNREYGMWISQSKSNTISGNTANGTSHGISLDSSSDNTVSENIVAFNNLSGFYECPACRRNLVFNNYANNTRNANINTKDTTWNITKTSGRNIVGGPYIGGNFWAKPDGTGYSQVTSDADGDGITDSAYIDESDNVTDYLPLAPVSNPQQPIMPVANFSTNVTSGFAPLSVQFNDSSQYAARINWDFEKDGSIDSTDKNPVHVYAVPGNYTVRLTTINENGTASTSATITVLEQPVAVFPVANFKADPTSGYAPLDVQFTDGSQYATSRSWDFGDGAISTEPNPMHTYSAAGTYTVNLKAGNENGTSPTPKTATITVTQQSSSSGGSSGGSSHKSSNGGSSGGGGAGGSPEPAKNVQVKEISQAFVTNGKPVKFDFSKNATCVVYVDFDAKKTAGKTTTIAEQLKGKSTLVSELSSGEIYKYFNLWVGNGGFATSSNIENPVVCFKVEKSWIQDKKIDQASITLNRYNEKKWAQLPVTLLREDNRYLYFTAETPGFSFFAITGKTVEKESGAKVKPETNTQAIEQNNTTSEAEPKTGAEQEPEKEKITSIPGFEMIFGIVCLITCIPA